MLDAYPVPVGNVWFRYVGNKTLEIMHSYVWEQIRRCGLRTLMHERMREKYPKHKFTTTEGNDASTPWLEKKGFQKDDVTDDWTLKPD